MSYYREAATAFVESRIEQPNKNLEPMPELG